jgi:Glucose / Sorbosone dehydrogenase
MKKVIKIVNIFFILFTLNLFSQVTYEREFKDVNFAFPTELKFYKTETERVFVVEQQGRIKVFPKVSNVTSAQVTTFLDISNNVRYSNGQEMGLLGMAFHPQFQTNRYIYVYYTKIPPAGLTNVRVVISRFTVSETNPNLVNANSELELFIVDKNQNNSNHNGGKIEFGSDGYLYFSIGDGGGANDPMNNAQNLNSAFGKICRIDVDLDGNNPIESNPALPDGRYEVPDSNPFVNKTGLDEIFAYGIRNIWKFSFDKNTNRIWGADVGQNAFEEINLIENGKNYGWKRFEGDRVSNDVPIVGTATAPVFFYGQTAGDKSITGGYVYRGTQVSSITPSITEKYIFGDYVTGRVWALDYNPTLNTASRTLLFKTNGQFISSFGEDSAREHYFTDYGAAVGIYKIKNGTTATNAVAVNGIGSWENLSQGINGVVNCVAADLSEKVYFGGNFNTAGTVNANNIAVWSSSTWSSLGTGSNGSINAIATYNGKVYAGGVFSQIGGVNAKNIAVWNGSVWQALGSGVEGPVAAMAIDSQGNVFVGGSFENAGTVIVRNIARWDGTQWRALSGGTGQLVGANNEIRSLAFGANGVLYLGGNFDQVGAISASRIATWNGTSWGTLGQGTSGFVEAIVTTPQAIYIGGNFALAGDLTVNRIAKWNLVTSQFEKLGNGLNNSVKSLIFDGVNLYAAGSFSNAFNTTQNIIVNNIARWNPTDEWKPLGINTNVGINVLVNGIAFVPNDNSKVFVGGNIDTAGNSLTNNAVLWKLDFLSINELFESKNLIIYPNPTTDSFMLSIDFDWVLYNSIGQKLDEGLGSEISLSKYSKGLYILVQKGTQNEYKIIKN